MGTVSFFTPIIFDLPLKTIGQKVQENVDGYFDLGLGRKKAKVISQTGSAYEAVLVEGSKPSYLTALKVISYFTLILPIIVLVAKAICRALHSVKVRQEVATPKEKEAVTSPLVVSDGSSQIKEKFTKSQRGAKGAPVALEASFSTLSEYLQKVIQQAPSVTNSYDRQHIKIEDSECQTLHTIPRCFTLSTYRSIREYDIYVKEVVSKDKVICAKSLTKERQEFTASFYVLKNSVTENATFKKEMTDACSEVTRSLDVIEGHLQIETDDSKVRAAQEERIKQIIVRILTLNIKTIIEEAGKIQERNQRLSFVLRHSTQDRSVDEAILKHLELHVDAKQLSSLSIVDIQNLHARSLRVTELTVKDLNEARDLTREDLKDITPELVGKITNNHLIGKLPNHLIRFLNPALFESLSTTQMRHLNTKEHISHLIAGWIQRKDKEIENCKSDEEKASAEAWVLGNVKDLTNNHIPLIEDLTVLKYLNDVQLKYLTKEQVQKITDSNILRRLTIAVQHVSPEQVSKLSAEQFDYLSTTEQVARVPLEHYDRLGRVVSLIPVGNDMSAIDFASVYTQFHGLCIGLPTKAQVEAITQPLVVASLGERLVYAAGSPRGQTNELFYIMESLQPQMMAYLPDELPEVFVRVITNPEAIRSLPKALKAKLSEQQQQHLRGQAPVQTQNPEPNLMLADQLRNRREVRTKANFKGGLRLADISSFPPIIRPDHRVNIELS